MVKVISVRFRTAGKIYFFDPGELEIQKGQNVIVETARGVEYGLVVSGIREIEEDKVIQPLKPVIRIATPEDDKQEATNIAKKDEAINICLEKIKKHNLDMKLVDAEYTFDNNKVLFYFTADGRIDFRELVKDLASIFKTRIELRQIGVRDEIKIMGGIGICGRVLCCHSYLSEFVPVSIKMAKEQNLSLNPTKISGVCGRLMCCLKNEEEIYGELNKKLPNPGDFVTTDDGLRGDVHSVNVLRQLVKVIVDVNDEKEIKEYHVDQLHFRRKSRKAKEDLTPEELKELEMLEEQERLEILEKQNAQREREENPGRFEKRDHRGKNDYRDRRDRGDRRERPDASATGAEQSEKPNRQNYHDRKERRNYHDRGDRPERSERTDRPDRKERPNRDTGMAVKTVGAEVKDASEKNDNRQWKEKQGRNRRHNHRNRSDKKE